MQYKYKKPNRVSAFLLAVILCNSVFNGYSVGAGSSYNGEWDLSARTVARLCYIVKNGLTNDKSVPPIPKDDYLRDNVCWKYQWNACGDSKEEEIIGPDKRKPCGFYQMVEAPANECNDN